MARVSTETLTVGILSLLFALVGAYMLRQYLQRDPTPPPPRRTRVPLAANDLPSGKRIAIGDIVLVPMTDEQMRDRNFPLDYTLLNARQIIGRVLREPLSQGEPFLVNRMYPVGMGPGIEERLKPGFRAVSIHVDGIAGVGGPRAIGNLVDVLFLPDLKTANVPRRMYTILEAVEVLSVEGGGSRDGKATVTLAVPPEEAMTLRLIDGGGSISLVLRNPNEPILGSMRPGKTIREALGFRDPEKQPPPPTVEFNTEVVRGGSRSINRFAFSLPRGNQVEDLLPSLSEPVVDLPPDLRGSPPPSKTLDRASDRILQDIVRPSGPRLLEPAASAPTEEETESPEDAPLENVLQQPQTSSLPLRGAGAQ